MHVTFEQIPYLVQTNAYMSVMIVRHLAFYEISQDFLTNAVE